MSLSKSRTIASLTKKNEILLLPGFEELDHCTAKELKEYVRKRAAIYAQQHNKKIKGFTVGDFIEIYNKDPKPYRPNRSRAIENLKEDINKIASSAKKAKDDLKEFEADKSIESKERLKAMANQQPPKKEDEEDEARPEQEYKANREQEEVEAVNSGMLTDAAKITTEAGFQALLKRNQAERAREEAERDRQWEAENRRLQEQRQRQWKAELEKSLQEDIIEEREHLRDIIKRTGKNSIEYKEALDFIRNTGCSIMN